MNYILNKAVIDGGRGGGADTCMRSQEKLGLTGARVERAGRGGLAPGPSGCGSEDNRHKRILNTQMMHSELHFEVPSALCGACTGGTERAQGTGVGAAALIQGLTVVAGTGKVVGGEQWAGTRGVQQLMRPEIC